MLTPPCSASPEALPSWLLPLLSLLHLQQLLSLLPTKNQKINQISKTTPQFHTLFLHVHHTWKPHFSCNLLSRISDVLLGSKSMYRKEVSIFETLRKRIPEAKKDSWKAGWLFAHQLEFHRRKSDRIREIFTNKTRAASSTELLSHHTFWYSDH